MDLIANSLTTAQINQMACIATKAN